MMDSRDVSNSNNNNIFYSSSLATSKRMQDGLSLLSITVHKRGSNFGQQPNDVNNQNQQASSSFLQQDQHQHYSQPHTHQQSSSFYYYNSRPEAHDGVTLESVTVVGPWREVIFPIAILTVSLFGILAVGAILLLWLKNNLKGQEKDKVKTSKKLKVAKVNAKVLLKQTKMSEDEGSQIENINSTLSAKPESPRSKSLDVPEAENASFSSQVIFSTSESTQQDPTVSTIYKNITSENLSTISTPGNLKRVQAKTSLNNISQISTSPSAVPSSPPLRSVHRKFSFNQSSFYEQQQIPSSKAEKYSANNSKSNNDNLPYFGKLGSKDECLISKIAVLKGDVCCVQPPQLHHAAADLDELTVASPAPICSSPKMVYTQSTTSEALMAIPLTTKAQKLSDDKENYGKCSTAFETSRNGKAFRGQHSWIEGNENQPPSNRKVLTQSPIFFANEQNSPNVCYDSSSSPTLIPSLTPSSVSSSATSTATNTTPNANLNSASSNTGRFTFSPKVISELGYQSSPQSASNHAGSGNEAKISNTYFRFPDVDSFTPPISAQTTNLNVSGKPTTFKIPSLVTSWIPSLETPTKEALVISEQELMKSSTTENIEDKQCPGIDAVDDANITNIPSISMVTEDTHKDSSPSSTEDKIQQMVSSTRATRRARLKSISLDSDGARILEENFATSIPVEELVEIAANQSHHLISGNQLQLPSLSQSQAQNENEECSYASYRKQRNIFNLTLNLNDKDESLMADDDYKFNEFYFEYYDYDDEEDEEYEMECGASGSSYSEKRKKQHSQLQTPKTPTLTQTRKKASSLDSDQSLSYMLPQPVRTQSAIDKSEHRVSSTRCAMNPSTATIRTSSLSVPTTPKRQPYRLPQQQSHGKYKQNRCMNDSTTSINNSPASERHLLCGFQQKLGSFEENADMYHSNVESDSKSTGIKAPYSNMSQQREQNLSVSNVNLKTLPEITPVCDFANKSNDQIMAEKPPIQTMNKSRSSILQRRGSNHSLTLNLDAATGGSGLSKGLSASNYSLGNLKGSHLSLASSSYNLQQQQNQHQNVHQSGGAPNVQTKKNLLQRRGSNTSLILNLQGSNSSLNRYNSHSSLNIQNQQNVRPAKKCLLERRNSNTSLTLINIQNRALSVSNCNLPGSICSLNSMATYQTQNEALMLEEEEIQMSVNNNQSSCCARAAAGGVSSESHLSPNCQQHGGRRKFLSSDSLHNITNSRAGCCCQQKETNMDAPHMCYHRGQMSNYGDEDWQNEKSNRNQQNEPATDDRRRVARSREDPRRHTLGGDMLHYQGQGELSVLQRSLDLDMRAYPPVNQGALFDDDPGIMSEVETASTGFRRGGKQRSSLPVVRTPSKTLERPLGLVFLQYRSETKRALLPNEITSIDTVRALFVRSFPRQLTMQYLEGPNVKIYIHDSSKDMFYELEDVRSHLREIRDRSVLRLFESNEVSAPQVLPGGPGIPQPLATPGAPGLWDSEQSYFSEPEFDSDYRHQHIHKSKTGKAPYYLGAQTLPRGMYSDRSKSTTGLPSKPIRSYGSKGSIGPSFQYSPDQLYSIPDGYMSSPERSGANRAYEEPYYTQYSGRGNAVTSIIDEEQGDANLADDQYAMYGVKGLGRIPHAANQMYEPTRPEDLHRIRVEHMERQLANLTGLVQKALTQKPAQPVVSNNQSTLGLPAQYRSDKSVSFEKSVSFSDDVQGTPKPYSPHHLADTKPSKPAIKSSTLPRTSSQERDRLKPAPPPKPLVLAANQYNADLSLAPEVYNNLRGLQKKAKDLRTEVRAMRRLTQTQAVAIREDIKDTFMRIRATLLSSSGALWGQSDQERTKMTREEEIYKQEVIRLEKDLSDLESSVEGLRGEVINRRTRVNMTAVEDMALVLSRASKTVAELKLRFPRLQQDLRTFLTIDMERICREENFLKEEPERLESALRRCKKLTGTLVTLKRLASVQEQRLPIPEPFLSEEPVRASEGPPNPNKPVPSPRLGAVSINGGIAPENALDALLDELQTFAKPPNGTNEIRPDDSTSDDSSQAIQTTVTTKMAQAQLYPDTISTNVGLRRLHSYPSGSDTDTSPPQPIRPIGKPPVPERNAELLSKVNSKRVPPPPPPRTSSRSPLASPTSPNMPHQMQQISDIDQQNIINSENMTKDSGMDSSSESVSSDNSQRQQALEMRHQELLKKQKQLQEQYQRLQQMSKNSIPLVTPDDKKKGRSGMSGSLKNLADENFSDGIDASNCGNIDKNGELSSTGTVSNLTKTTNKVYETDIL